MQSIEGYTAFFILYDWTTNAILATPVKDTTDESMVAAFKENIEYLEERGFKPVFNVIDNISSKAIRAYLKEAKVGLRLVEPNDHRASARKEPSKRSKTISLADYAELTEIFQ